MIACMPLSFCRREGLACSREKGYLWPPEAAHILVGRKRIKARRRESAIEKQCPSKKQEHKQNLQRHERCFLHAPSPFVFVSFAEAALRFCPQRAAFFWLLFFRGKKRTILWFAFEKETIRLLSKAAATPEGGRGAAHVVCFASISAGYF